MKTCIYLALLLFKVEDMLAEIGKAERIQGAITPIQDLLTFANVFHFLWFTGKKV